MCMGAFWRMKWAWVSHHYNPLFLYFSLFDFHSDKSLLFEFLFLPTFALPIPHFSTASIPLYLYTILLIFPFCSFFAFNLSMLLSLMWSISSLKPPSYNLLILSPLPVQARQSRPFPLFWTIDLSSRIRTKTRNRTECGTILTSDMGWTQRYLSVRKIIRGSERKN